MNTIEDINDLLELIEDHDSEFWETEISDLDGQPCKVVNMENATRLINEYAKNRASIEQQVRPDKSGKCAYPKAFIVCSWFDAGLCKSPDGICRST